MIRLSVFAPLFASLVLSSVALAAKPNKNAPQGGTFVMNLVGEPTNIHPYLSTDLYSRKVREFLAEGLCTRDSETYEWKPRLAEKWEISKDGKVFTFHLRKGATFHDGKEITAEDVKFSFDAIFEPKYEAAHLRPFYENIEKVEAVDSHTIKAYAKNNYFKNFDVIAGLEILPKHIYSNVDKSKKMTREYIGAGPYRFEKWDKGQMIVVRKFDKWFGKDLPDFKGQYNFDRVTFRFYKEETVILERAKRGDLDYVDDMRAEAYVVKAVGAPWGESVFKKKIENSEPKSWSFIALNQRQELFKDKNVRLALLHLMNRRELAKKFLYDMSEPVKGPTPNVSEYASPKVKVVEFDTKKARDLLTKAGWKDEDKNGVLEKTEGGKKVEFRFSLAYSNKDVEKYWTFYREDLKRAGIHLDLRYLEWNSFIKILDDNVEVDAKGEYKNSPSFDAVALAWGGGDLHWDPKQIWHSSSATSGGSNFIAYKNPEVDKLIDEGRQIIDRNKRRPVFRRVYEIIAADVPYLFFMSPKYDFYAMSNKVQAPADTFKYEVGWTYWWSKL